MTAPHHAPSDLPSPLCVYAVTSRLAEATQPGAWFELPVKPADEEHGVAEVCFNRGLFSARCLYVRGVLLRLLA
jgi:hypothetical protein